MSEFLAEARVRVVPDTTLFRTQLEAQLKAATAAPVVIPVTAAAGVAGAAGATRIQQELAGAADAAATSTNKLTAAQNAAVVAGQKLAFAQQAVVGAASAVGAAEVTLKRSTDAVTASQVALQKALTQADPILATTTAETLGLARAQQTQAEAALVAARAQAAYDRSLKGVTGGTASAALSLVGLRGATLAASAPFLAGAAAAIIFTKSVGAIADLEQELNVFQATAEATDEQMKEVSATARRLGTDLTLPGVGAADAAEAMTTLVKAGLSVEDAMAGTKGALQLATAAEIENAEAAQITASALNAFGLSGTEATHVADLLTGAANASQASIVDMGIALRQASAAANQVGIGVEDTVALLSLLAKNGIAASDAGTSLRTAIIRLVNPTEKARTEIEKLNLDLRNQAGELRPDIFAQFANATRELTRAERDRIAAVIFGQDAFRAQGILAREGTEGLRRAKEETDRAGEAARIAGARTEGLSGKLGQLRNNAEEAGLTIGDFLKPGVENFVDLINSSFTPAADEFSQKLEIIGEDWEEVRAILAQPINLQLQPLNLSIAEISRELGFLTGIAREFTSRGLEVPPDIAAKIKALAKALRNDLGGAFAHPTEGAARLELALQKLGDEGDKTRVKMAGLADVLTLDIAVAAAEGNEQAELAGLRRKEQRQDEFLQRLLARPQTAATVKTATAAAANLERTRDQIQTILDGQAASADEAASKARDAKAKRDEADIRLLEAAVTPLERKLAGADLTATLADNIKFTNQLIALYRKQIEQASKRIEDVETRNKVLAQLDADLFAAILDRKRLEAENRQNIREALEERQAEAVRAAEIRVEFADLAENVKKGVQARLRLIAALKREARVLKLQGNALEENKLERARIRKEIRDLLEEGKEDQNIGKQINFRILQQAQGFATSIMSNLIPASATAGALAGRGPAAAPQEGIRREAGLAAGRDTTVSRGQGNETNAILRSILRQLENLNGRTLHPEATRQRRQQGASQDTVAL